MPPLAEATITRPSPPGIRDEEELAQRRTLRDYYIMLRERLWIALPLALLVAVGYGYWKSRETPMYSSTATMEFEKPETVVTTQGVMDPSIHSDIDIATYVQLLNSQKLRAKVIESFTPEERTILLRPALKKSPARPAPAVGRERGAGPFQPADGADLPDQHHGSRPGPGCGGTYRQSL